MLVRGDEKMKKLLELRVALCVMASILISGNLFAFHQSFTDIFKKVTSGVNEIKKESGLKKHQKEEKKKQKKELPNKKPKLTKKTSRSYRSPTQIRADIAKIDKEIDKAEIDAWDAYETYLWSGMSWGTQLYWDKYLFFNKQLNKLIQKQARLEKELEKSIKRTKKSKSQKKINKYCYHQAIKNID
jgi:hypothetical protein